MECNVSGIDYSKIAPLVRYDGQCCRCQESLSVEYPLRLYNIAGDRMYFCSYACLEGYRASLLT